MLKKSLPTSINRDYIISLLHRWGKWQRTAKDPNQDYAISQYDTPLTKQRNVVPIFRDEVAEQMEDIIKTYLPMEYRLCLELTFVKEEINAIAATFLGCSEPGFKVKRREAIAMVWGIYTVI